MPYEGVLDGYLALKLYRLGFLWHAFSTVFSTFVAEKLTQILILMNLPMT